MQTLLNFLATIFNSSKLIKISELGFKSQIETLKFVAYKTIIYTILTVGSIFSTSLVLEFVFSNIYAFIETKISGINVTDISLTLHVSGLLAYFVDVFRIDDALRILLSAIVLKFSLKFVPFTKF